MWNRIIIQTQRIRHGRYTERLERFFFIILVIVFVAKNATVQHQKDLSSAQHTQQLEHLQSTDSHVIATNCWLVSLVKFAIATHCMAPAFLCLFSFCACARYSKPQLSTSGVKRAEGTIRGDHIHMTSIVRERQKAMEKNKKGTETMRVRLSASPLHWAA